MTPAKSTFSEDGTRQTLTYTVQFDIPGYNHIDYVSATEFDVMVKEGIKRLIEGTVNDSHWQANLTVNRKGFGHIA